MSSATGETCGLDALGKLNAPALLAAVRLSNTVEDLIFPWPFARLLPDSPVLLDVNLVVVNLQQRAHLVNVHPALVVRHVLALCKCCG